MYNGAATWETCVTVLWMMKQSYHMTWQFHCYLYPLKKWKHIHTKTLTQIIRAALITVAQRWQQPRCPSTNECINKIGGIHTMECYLAIKKKMKQNKIKQKWSTGTSDNLDETWSLKTLCSVKGEHHKSLILYVHIHMKIKN